MICFWRLVFLNSSYTSGNQMAVYHSELTVLRCSNGSMCFVPEQLIKIHSLPRLLQHIHIFCRYAYTYLQYFCAPIHPFYWSIVKLCSIQRAQFFVAAKYSCNINTATQGCLYLTVCHMMILAISVHIEHRCFFRIPTIWTTFTKFILE